MEKFRHLNHKLSFWGRHNEEIGLLFVMVAVLLVGTVSVLELDKIEGVFRHVAH